MNSLIILGLRKMENINYLCKDISVINYINKICKDLCFSILTINITFINIYKYFAYYNLFFN
jgi:hypothetical protein